MLAVAYSCRIAQLYMIEFKTRYQKISLVDTALLGDCKQTK